MLGTDARQRHAREFADSSSTSSFVYRSAIHAPDRLVEIERIDWSFADQRSHVPLRTYSRACRQLKLGQSMLVKKWIGFRGKATRRKTADLVEAVVCDRQLNASRPLIKQYTPPSALVVSKVPSGTSGAHLSLSPSPSRNSAGISTTNDSSAPVGCHEAVSRSTTSSMRGRTIWIARVSRSTIQYSGTPRSG